MVLSVRTRGEGDRNPDRHDEDERATSWHLALRGLESSRRMDFN
jgi:hypothetical protein